MNYLNQLTPAEVYFITKNNISKREILKLTLIDLILKDALKLETLSKKASTRDRVRDYRYVARGTNFMNYKPKNHERVFFSIFENEKDMEVLLKKMITISFENSIFLKSNMYSITILLKCFSQNFYQRIFGTYSITDFGKEYKRKVEKEINDLNNQFSSPITSNNKTQDLIKLIGANVLFIETINNDYLNQLVLEINTKIKMHINSSDSSGCGGGGSSSSDSGCGSSGCGGCGGCGG